MSRKIIFENSQLSLFGTVKLASLIAHLQLVEYPTEQYVQRSARTVSFAFGGLRPTRIDSYRGHYDHLAIGFSEEGMFETVAEFRANLQAAIGAEFHGYKGGAYRMYADTPVWVANRGDVTGTTIVGLHVESSHVSILTGYEP